MPALDERLRGWRLAESTRITVGDSSTASERPVPSIMLRNFSLTRAEPPPATDVDQQPLHDNNDALVHRLQEWSRKSRDAPFAGFADRRSVRGATLP